MLMLAGWMPFQSVAALRSMYIPAVTQSSELTDDIGSKSAMGNVCHDQSNDADKPMTVNGAHSMQCSACVPLCGGIPPVAVSVREFSPQVSLFLKASIPLYKDHIPGVVSPPPVTFIL